MNLDFAQNLFLRLQKDEEIQNYIAQANARYILFNVKEPISNFPNYTSFLDQRLNQIAIKYLSVGCSFAENEQFISSIQPLEIAAKIIEYAHRPQQNRQLVSTYYLLISSLSYYASGHYSKSFIIINEIETSSLIANMISGFLKKDYTNLIVILNSVLLNDEYSDEKLSTEKSVIDKEKKIFILLYAKCFANLIEFIFSGNIKWLTGARELIQDIIALALAENDVATWWSARLFRIIIEGFLQNSTWKILSPLIGQYNDELANRYILNLAFNKPHIVELFISQKEAIDKVLNSDSKGAVISLPTSSGKTRIAEIIITELFAKEPAAKVLYIAPFRSLAFEIEESFEKSFTPLGFIPTHLYGGSQFSKLDETLISESSIIIATPEKSKAIIRANPELTKSFKLVIIDEGHLLGANVRYLLSELLIEELKMHLKKNDGKIFLLSAVLPNVEDISRWITNEPNQYVISKWRPSNQRFGYLEWTGSAVHLRWRGKPESFNNNFVKQYEIQRPRSVLKFPGEKKEAVAATAVRLMDLGTILIFVGQTTRVLPQARAVLTAMRNEVTLMNWENEQDWKQFILCCEEAFGRESEVFKFAQYGILCHSSKIPSEVRISMERLIRFGKPRIIVSTNTLGQGVNLGINTVIFANLYLNHNEPIGLRDFWNITGRAGRAFIDTEGKILFALDRNDERTYKREKRFVDSYLDQSNLEKSQSGLLILIKIIKNIANKNNVDFELLLQLLAENNWEDISRKISEEDVNNIEGLLDLIDDSILNLDIEYDSVNFIEDHFKESLAYIQAGKDSVISQANVLSFLQARNDGIKLMLGDEEITKSYIKGGIPLRACSRLFELVKPINALIEEYNSSDKSVLDLVVLLENIESLALTVPTFGNIREKHLELINELRLYWISGEPLNKIIKIDKKNTAFVCSQYFGYKIPFLLNAIAKRMKDELLEDESNFISELAILCELGLPNMLAAKIFLAGVRSRVSALELSEIINVESVSLSIKQLNTGLIKLKDKIKSRISENTYDWLNLLEIRNAKVKLAFNTISNFTFNDNTHPEETLNVRSFGDQLYLSSPDYEYKLDVTDNDLNLIEAADLLDINFIYNDDIEVYSMNVRNPRVK